jgi:hypothetical protein
MPRLSRIPRKLILKRDKSMTLERQLKRQRINKRLKGRLKVLSPKVY